MRRAAKITITIFLFILIAVVVALIIRQHTEAFSAPSPHACVTHLPSTQIDLSSKLDVSLPQCKKFEKLDLADVLMDLRANVARVGPDQEERPLNACVLPQHAIETHYTNVQLTPTSDPNATQKCVLGTTASPIYLPSNVPNDPKTTTDAVYSGCVIDPAASNFQAILTDLFYAKHRHFFQDLVQEANQCFKLEEDKARFQQQLQQAMDLNTQEERATQEKETQLTVAQADKLAQEAKTAEAKKTLQLQEQEHRNAKDTLQRLQQTLQQRQGLSYGMFYNYFWDNPAFFQQTNLKYHEGRITDVNSVHAFPLWHMRREFVSIELKGYFRPSTTGWWQFNLLSDDAAYLWLGARALPGKFNTQNALVAQPGLHGAYWSSGRIYLQQDAMYPMRVHHGNNWGGWALAISFSGPNTPTRTNGQNFYFSADF